MKQQSHEEICVREYFRKYFEEMLLKDIRMLIDNPQPFTIPYIALVCMAIDFLGGLEHGFTSENGRPNSGPRSRAFIKNWLVRANEIYACEGMPGFIYDSVRNGVIHQAIFKEEAESYSGAEDVLGKNLYVRKDPRGKERIFIHPIQFVNDFIEAQKIFREEYLKEENFVAVYRNLQKLKNNTKGGYSELIGRLKEKGYEFEDILSPSPSAPPEDCEE